MNQKLLLFFLFVLSVIAYPQYQLKFITVNQYGNNLYIDNLQLGKQCNNDIGVVSINNILSDTNYTVGSNTINVAPNVSIVNSGKNNITSAFNVTMTVTPGNYTSTKSVASINHGEIQNITFDNLTITPGQPVNISITANLPGDENSSNNVLNQYSMFLAGVARTLLFEQWTSSTCAPCASNNPTIDAFVNARFDSLVTIKYHMNWPSPGNDPMYAYNPTQANDRRNYYGINSVPSVIMDGLVHPSYPYTQANSLLDAYNSRNVIGTPLKVTVVDTRLQGDTIKSDITVQVVSPLKAGNYFLRVNAVERKIEYATAPGSNGEKVFYDVFRKAYPNSTGTPVPTAVGTYNFTIKYPIDKAVWVDSLIYTAAYVQNDATKEVLSAGHSRHVTTEKNIVLPETICNMKPAVAPDLIESTEKSIVKNDNKNLTGTYMYEMFEGSFPPAGWKLLNPDGSVTFQQFAGANSPALGGTHCITVPFYEYSSTGKSDTLYTKVYSGLTAADSIKFDYAYAQYQTEQDRLVVKLSIDGGQTFPFTIFDKQGAALATAPATTNEFVPSSSQWATFSLPLDQILPVELTSFTSNVNANSVELKWTTATESNNYGFEIQKKVGESFITIGFVKGNGTTTETRQYSFIDKDLQIGNYMYRIKQIDLNGAFVYSDVLSVNVNTLSSYSLEQNYPNPFNPSTKIKFNLPQDSRVSLKLFNVLGQEVMTVVNKNMAAGLHEVVLNASNLNSGVYFYNLETVDNSGHRYFNSKKMTLLK
jgi:hypothetical protein